MSEPEFLDWISDFYSHRLDRSRPLWEMVLLDGLIDGRWALICKTHHCLVDGVGSVDATDLLLDTEPAPGEPSERVIRPPRPAFDRDGPTRVAPPYARARRAGSADTGLAAARAGTHARDASA